MTAGVFLLVLLIGVVAGTFGAIIGSSLLLIVPALIILGLPAPVALGTGKVSALARDMPALIVFHRSGKVVYGVGILFTISGLAGTVAGSFVALAIEPELLEYLISAFTIGTGILLVFRPDMGLKNARRIDSPVLVRILSVVLGALSGFYAGVFGGGVNLLIIFAFILLLGHDFLTAVATSKLPNIVFMLAFTAIFAAYDQIDYVMALPLVIGMGIGGHYGAKLAVYGGNALVRKLFVALAIALALKMIFD